jgi:hypothetical protein
MSGQQFTHLKKMVSIRLDEPMETIYMTDSDGKEYSATLSNPVQEDDWKEFQAWKVGNAQYQIARAEIHEEAEEAIAGGVI